MSEKRREERDRRAEKGGIEIGKIGEMRERRERADMGEWIDRRDTREKI